MQEQRSWIEGLAEATEPEHLRALGLQFAEEAGYGHFFYGVLRLGEPEGPTHVCISGCPSAWARQYGAGDLHRVDPLLRRALKTPLPFEWSDVDCETERDTAFFESAVKCGFARGLTVPLAGLRGEAGQFNLMGPRLEEDQPPMLEERMMRAMWFAHHFHAAVNRICFPVTGPALTAREAQCLFWVADGTTSREVAERLEISERTVLHHLAVAAEKIGSRGRVQTLNRAITTGMLNLRAVALEEEPVGFSLLAG